jgi:DNA-binding CsgD family transcriptional regulator
VTGDAAGLEDLMRWLGIAVTIVGALVINPAATLHFARGILDTIRRLGRRAGAFLTRYLPWLRRDATIRVGRASEVGLAGSGTMSARGIVGWGPDATADQKLDLLDARTRRLHEEIRELQLALRKAEKGLRRELLVTVAKGRTNAEIADELHVSLSTVKFHLASLMTKIGARNRVEIAIWAYETRRVRP